MSLRLFALLGACCLLVLGLSGPVRAESKAKDAQPATYIKLDPPFVVNVQDDGANRFLQVTAEVKVASESSGKTLERYSPPIRDAMIMLLSEQTLADVRTVAGKQKLRKKALQAIQQVLKENTGKPVVKGIYFTGFVIQ